MAKLFWEKGELESISSFLQECRRYVVDKSQSVLRKTFGDLSGLIKLSSMGTRERFPFLKRGE